MGSEFELLLRARFIARPQERLAPFEMQAAPVRRLFVGLSKFRDSKIASIIADQRFAP
jgi:hypothetical protein